MKGRKSIVVSLLLVFLSSSSVFAFGTNKFEKEVEIEKSAVKLLREVEKGGYKIITTDELKKVLDEKEKVLIIDTMPYKASYAKAHIPSAQQFLFPIPDMVEWDSKETDNKSAEDFKKVLGADKDLKIIVYCGFVKCTRSHNGALWAKKLGYTNVYRYPGGIYAWKGAGFEVGKVE